MRTQANILVTGANGFIGRNLVPVLLSRGKRVRCLYRRQIESCEVECAQSIYGDLLKAESLPPAFDGIETAYYLVHSLDAGRKCFQELERSAAENFVAVANRAGVRRVIYLSGLGERGAQLSAHLDSRSEVEKILGRGSFQVTTFRAAIIIGAGGISFELLRYLVRTQPFLLDSSYLDTVCQPIALDDVLYYLAECLDREETTGRCFDICGPEVLSYRELLEKIAQLTGDVNLFLPVPRIPPWLVGFWVGLLSRQNRNVVSALLEGLGNKVVCKDHMIRELFHRPPISLDQAIKLAVGKKVWHSNLPV